MPAVWEDDEGTLTIKTKDGISRIPICSCGHTLWARVQNGYKCLTCGTVSSMELLVAIVYGRYEWLGKSNSRTGK